MFKWYIFSKHRSIYREIARKLDCSPQEVYEFAHKRHIIPHSDFEEDVKAELLAHKLISRDPTKVHYQE